VSADLPLERLGRRLGLQPSSGGIYARPAARRQTRPMSVPVRPVEVVPPVNLTALLRLEVDLAGGPDRYAVRCRVVHRDDATGARLLDPPPPWRGRLRLLHAPDPNTGQHVLLTVRADQAATCHQAAAATFGIHPDFYDPTREV